ncbi:MAG: PIN domain-containing protein [Verrucomicrobiota bacterium]|nr:PIN domain-containing protein [Verrucomicrobiota bacterium]
MVLVDSSIYIDLLRRGIDPVAELTARFEPTEIVGCDLVRCEVLRGMMRPRTRKYLADFFDLLVHARMDHRAWRDAENLAWRLARAGKILPLTDLIIAVCALRTGAAVATRDAHFASVPRLRLVRWEGAP